MGVFDGLQERFFNYGKMIDSGVAIVSPQSALKRQQARLALRAYEAANPSRFRKATRSVGSADQSVIPAARSLREQARWLEENHDLASGALGTMVNQIIGPSGIGVEPQPKDTAGNLIESLADDIRMVMEDAGEKPEVTGQYNDASMQRLLCRSWLRDGEFFAQKLRGNISGLNHRTVIPFSLELLEADMVPINLDFAGGSGSTRGIEYNAWGAPIGYRVYKTHPGSSSSFIDNSELKWIPAENMLHTKMTTRIGQTRGMSVFSSVITRLDGLKDYEESEIVASRISAAMSLQINRGSADLYVPPTSSDECDAREFKIAPGMVFDDLLPGESVSVIESNRPNALLADFRGSMVRMVAAGMGGTYSSFAKSYEGSYSSQRQELVEGYQSYKAFAIDFSSQFVRPLYRERLLTAIQSGEIKVPKNIDERTLFDAAYHGQAMAWIDPSKEAKAWETLVQAGFESQEAVIRARGRTPAEVRPEIIREREWAEENDLSFSSDVAATVSQPNSPAADDPEDDPDKPKKDEDDATQNENTED